MAATTSLVLTDESESREFYLLALAFPRLALSRWKAGFRPEPLSPGVTFLDVLMENATKHGTLSAWSYSSYGDKDTDPLVKQSLKALTSTHHNIGVGGTTLALKQFISDLIKEEPDSSSKIQEVFDSLVTEFASRPKETDRASIPSVYHWERLFFLWECLPEEIAINLKVPKMPVPELAGWVGDRVPFIFMDKVFKVEYYDGYTKRNITKEKVDELLVAARDDAGNSLLVMPGFSIDKDLKDKLSAGGEVLSAEILEHRWESYLRRVFDPLCDEEPRYGFMYSLREEINGYRERYPDITLSKFINEANFYEETQRTSNRVGRVGANAIAFKVEKVLQTLASFKNKIVSDIWEAMTIYTLSKMASPGGLNGAQMASALVEQCKGGKFADVLTSKMQLAAILPCLVNIKKDAEKPIVYSLQNKLQSWACEQIAVVKNKPELVLNLIETNTVWCGVASNTSDLHYHSKLVHEMLVKDILPNMSLDAVDGYALLSKRYIDRYREILSSFEPKMWTQFSPVGRRAFNTTNNKNGGSSSTFLKPRAWLDLVWPEKLSISSHSSSSKIPEKSPQLPVDFARDWEMLSTLAHGVYENTSDQRLKRNIEWFWAHAPRAEKSITITNNTDASLVNHFSGAKDDDRDAHPKGQGYYLLSKYPLTTNFWLHLLDYYPQEASKLPLVHATMLAAKFAQAIPDSDSQVSQRVKKTSARI